MTARPYQLEAINAIKKAIAQGKKSVACIPTGGGKGYILGDIARGIHSKGLRMLVLAHVAELVEQNAAQCRRHLPTPSMMVPDPVGIVSAGLGERNYGAQIVSAGIQTAFRCACEIGAVQLIIIDESHLVQSGSDAGMYRKFLAEMITINPKVWIIGLTATPYRMKGGPIYGEDPDLLFDDLCYHVSVLDLINQGYLCRLTSKAPSELASRDFSQLHIRAGEFVAEEVEAITTEDCFVRDGVADMIVKAAGRRSILVFCSSIAHAEKVCDEIRAQTMGETCEIIIGETDKKERKDLIYQFKNFKLKWLVNVGVLTTGFDAPNVDCVALFRPTVSPGLFYQCCGRGFRLHPDKENTLILDFGGNIERHGPVDMLDQIKTNKPKKKTSEQAPVKVCDNCGEYVPIQDRVCPACNYVFPPPVRTEPERTASDSPITSDQVEPYEEMVHSVTYSIHQKAGSDGEKIEHFTLKVGYVLGNIETVYEWVCPNHSGFARNKFEKWWRERSISEIPEDVEQAEYLANNGALSTPTKLILKKIPSKRFPEIVQIELPKINEDWFCKPVTTTHNDDSEDDNDLYGDRF
jgi:DNA repair protein RadD